MPPQPGPATVPPRPPMPPQPGPVAAPQPMPPQPMPMPPQPGPATVPARPSIAPAPAPVAPVAPAVPAYTGHQAAAAVMSGPSVLGLAQGEAILTATAGDLLNSGKPVAVLVTEQHLVLIPAQGTPRVENIPGIRHAVVADFDGDGTNELLLVNETQVWVTRFSETGSVPSGKVTLQQVPENLTLAPFTRDGQAVLMQVTKETVFFYVQHPARGLVQFASAPVPAIEM